MRIAFPLVVVAFVLALLSVSPEPAAAHCGGGDINQGDSQVPPPPDDLDCDFVKDDVDNCPPIGYDDIRTRNPNQEDADNDGAGTGARRTTTATASSTGPTTRSSTSPRV